MKPTMLKRFVRSLWRNKPASGEGIGQDTGLTPSDTPPSEVRARALVNWLLKALGILGVVLFISGLYVLAASIKIDFSLQCVKGGRCDESNPGPLGYIVVALGILLLLVWRILVVNQRKR